MRGRYTGVQAIVVAVVVLACGSVTGQEPTAGAADWTPPQTPWGDPDLQGIWSPGYTLTPVERPDRFEGREFLSDAEVAVLESGQITSEGRDFRPDAGTVADVEGAYNDAFTGRGKEVIRTRRTSLVVDPPDGKIPPLTPEAQARRSTLRRRPPSTSSGEIGTDVAIPYPVDADSSSRGDNPEDRPSDRCLGITLPFIRGTSGTYSRIVQTPGAVTLYHEDGHRGGGYRTVHIDGRPHLPPHIRQWLGDSIGQWEGNTLVVDTTNFTDKTDFRGSQGNLHLVERFTRVAPDLVMYEVTIEDPTVWTAPWTVEIPVTEVDNERNQIFEAACHEGNYAMTSILAGARAQEAASAR